jgi:hypothetical protein
MQQPRDARFGSAFDFILAEDADLMAGMPPGWARMRATAGGLGGRVIDGRVFVRRTSVHCFLDVARRARARKARPAPAHLRLVVDNDRPDAK